MVASVVVGGPALALFLDVAHLATRGHFPIPADDAAAGKCPESEESNEAHAPSIGAQEASAQPLNKNFPKFCIGIRLIGCRTINVGMGADEFRAIVQLDINRGSAPNP